MISIKSFLFILSFILLIPLVFAVPLNWDYRVPLNLTETLGINRTFYVVEFNISNFTCNTLRATQCVNENALCTKEVEVPIKIISFGEKWRNIELVVNLTGNSWRQFYIYCTSSASNLTTPKYYWVKYNSSFSFDLRDIDIVNDREAYAVGGNGDFSPGKAIKWNGKKWYEIPVIGGEKGALSGVGFWSFEKGWAAGDHEPRGIYTKDNLFLWDEVNQLWYSRIKLSWRRVGDLDTLNENFSVVGSSWGKILQWNGSNWKEYNSGFKYHAGRVTIVSEKDAWATGIKSDNELCGLTHWNGSKWISQPCPSQQGYGTAIDCWNSSLCFAATSKGEIFKYNGTDWVQIPSPTTLGIFGIKLVSPERGWACGENGTLLMWNSSEWVEVDNVTPETLGNIGSSASSAGDGIDMLNSSYGWIIGKNGIILHRGSVRVEKGKLETNSKFNLILEEDKIIYLDFKTPLRVSTDLKNLSAENFKVFSNGKELNFTLEKKGNKYYFSFPNIFSELGELGKFNLTIFLNSNFTTVYNSTFIYLFKFPNYPIILSDLTWKNIIASSATGRPVLIGEGRVDMKNLGGELFIIGNVTPFNFDGSVYRVNDRESLQRMFLKGRRKVLVKTPREGIFASRIANELDGIIVFDGCSDCINLSNKSLRELEEFFADVTGKSNYFILVNEARNNSLLAAQLSVYRKGFPIVVNVTNISYPREKTQRKVNETNERNRISEIKNRVKDVVSRYCNLDENYTFGLIPKLAIVGSEYDIPYLAVWDLGFEDIVREPSGDDLWIWSDNIYGDLNNDGFMELATGRIRGDLTRGSWQILSTRLFDSKEKKIGIIAEYATPGVVDVYTQGGGMMNGFLVHLKLKEYSPERMVEVRSRLIGKKEEEVELIKKIIFKLSKKISWIYSKINLSQRLIYLLLERNWVDWKIPGVPKFLKEVSKDGARELMENKEIVFFFGEGDGEEIVFYDYEGDDRNIYLDPYPGPKLNLSEVGSNFLYLDHSYSFKFKPHVLSPGFVGNTGLVHFTVSKDSAVEFAKNFDTAGQALTESKNFFVKVSNSDLKKKEYFEKILYADPGLKLLGEFAPKGYFSATKEGDHFYDRVEITPEEEFSNFTTVTLEPNKPILPVYTKSIILPSGARIRSIKVEKTQRVLSTTFPLYRDKYYIEENFSGIYPEKEWWKKEREFLDGRKELTFSVPVRYNGSEAILNSFVFKVEYDADIEIYNFSASKAKPGEKANFSVKIYSSKERNAEVFVRAGGKEVSKKVHLHRGENLIYLTCDSPEKAGEYIATTVVIAENLRAGPRATFLEVESNPNLFIQTSNYVFKLWGNFLERISEFFSSEKVKVKRETPKIKTETWLEGNMVVKRIVTTNFTLTLTQNSKERKLNFTSPSGCILIKEISGRREEVVYGGEKVRKEFEKAKKMLKEQLKLLK